MALGDRLSARRSGATSGRRSTSSSGYDDAAGAAMPGGGAGGDADGPAARDDDRGRSWPAAGARAEAAARGRATAWFAPDPIEHGPSAERSAGRCSAQLRDRRPIASPSRRVTTERRPCGHPCPPSSGIADRVDAVACADDGLPNKPDPAMVLAPVRNQFYRHPAGPDGGHGRGVGGGGAAAGGGHACRRRPCSSVSEVASETEAHLEPPRGRGHEFGGGSSPRRSLSPAGFSDAPRPLRRQSAEGAGGTCGLSPAQRTGPYRSDSRPWDPAAARDLPWSPSSRCPTSPARPAAAPPIPRAPPDAAPPCAGSRRWSAASRTSARLFEDVIDESFTLFGVDQAGLWMYDDGPKPLSLAAQRGLSTRDPGAGRDPAARRARPPA